MGGAASGCSCQTETTTQELNGPSTMYPKISVTQFQEEQEYNEKPKRANNSEMFKSKDPTQPKIYDFILNHTSRRLEQTINDIKENQVFLDNEFPPTLDSLTKNTTQFHEAKDLEWRRLGSIFNKENITLIDTSSSSKISSASSLIGSNNPLSFALAVLGSRPELVKQLFEVEQYNEKGVYSVWLNLNGEWKEVIVDDQIPCLPSKNYPAFIKPANIVQNGAQATAQSKFEMWSMLIEKACAKLYQSYDKLDIGSPEQIITDLTGAPYKNALTVDTNIAWKFITQNLEKKYIVTATPKLPVSNGLISPSKNGSFNLSSPTKEAGREEHKSITEAQKSVAKFVEVIDFKEVEVNSFIREKIIKIRNPLGPAEWKGDWSAQSQKWTQELRQSVENTKDEQHFKQLHEQGITWIPVESFCQSYSHVVSNCIHPNYYFYSKRILSPSFENSQVTSSSKNELNIYESAFKKHGLYLIPIEVKEDNSNVYIQYHLADKRLSYKLRGSNGDNPSKQGLKFYASINFFLFKGDQMKVTEFMREEYCNDRNGFIENTFNKGSYLAVLNIKWASLEESKGGLVISTYSDKRVSINEPITDPNSLDNAIDQCLMSIPPLMSKDIYKYPEDQEHLERFHNVALNYSYYVYTNSSQTTVLKETAIVTDRKYMTICLPYFNSDSYTVEVHPLQKKIVKYAIQSEGMGLQSGKFEYHSIFSFSNEDLYPKIKGDVSNKQLQVVDGETTQVEFYQHLFNGGLALFFLNNSFKTYCEEFKVEFVNLQPSQEGYSSNQTISIEVPSKRTKLIIFPQSDPLAKPSFKVISIKKSLK